MAMDVIYINCKRTSLKQRKTAISNDIFYFLFFIPKRFQKYSCFWHSNLAKAYFQKVKNKDFEKRSFFFAYCYHEKEYTPILIAPSVEPYLSPVQKL